MTARDAWTYLDCAATHPLRPAVRAAMQRAAGAPPPSAVAARAAVAAALDLEPASVSLTAGGSAANNLALQGASGHVISQPTEHPSVLEALEALRARGCEVELLPVDARGAVDPEVLRRSLRADTTLVALMHANNETGCMQPIPRVAALLAQHPARLHVDAVQTAPWLDVRPSVLGADTVALSLHKLGGPRGVGLLLGERPSTHLDAPLDAEGLAGIVAALAERQPAEAAAVRASRDALEQALRARIADLEVHAAGEPRLPGVLCVSAPGVNGDALVIELEGQGIAVATGAACASGDPAPSHVLRALGVSPELARASVRFSLGAPLGPVELAHVAGSYAAAVERMRSLR